MKPLRRALVWLALFPATGWAAEEPRAVHIEGAILDHATSQPIPARLYVRGSAGGWHFAESAVPTGSALRYEKQRANTNAVEQHVTLSAHPFRVDLSRIHAVGSRF